MILKGDDILVFAREYVPRKYHIRVNILEYGYELHIKYMDNRIDITHTHIMTYTQLFKSYNPLGIIFMEVIWMVKEVNSELDTYYATH